MSLLRCAINTVLSMQMIVVLSWPRKSKALIDDTAIYADWLNNDNLKSKLASQLTFLLYKEGYPPQWDEEVFQKVLEQVENYKKHE